VSRGHHDRLAAERRAVVLEPKADGKGFVIADTRPGNATTATIRAAVRRARPVKGRRSTGSSERRRAATHRPMSNLNMGRWVAPHPTLYAQHELGVRGSAHHARA
jgi:hypothetical protein